MALVPNTSAASLKVTVPVAVFGDTVAVNTTGCPNTEGFTEAASVVVVGAGAVMAMVSRAKSVQAVAQVVRLKTAEVMLAPVWSKTPMYVATPVLLATVKDPSDVEPLKTWILAVKAPGKSACRNAPKPATGLANVKVTGPLPPLPASDVHSRLCPAVKPVPVQLQGDAEQATEMILFAPARPIVTVDAKAVLPVKVAAKTLPSAPCCDQFSESVAAWLDGLVMTFKVSA